MSISCQICLGRFWKSLQNLRQSNLNQYIEKFNKVTVKSYEMTKCELCDKIFFSKKASKAHFTIMHDRIKTFECEICSNKLKNEEVLNKHILRVHQKKKPELKECSICKVAYFEFSCQI